MQVWVEADAVIGKAVPVMGRGRCSDWDPVAGMGRGRCSDWGGSSIDG